MTNRKEFSTEQESFWAGEFGNEYLERNRDVAAPLHRFAAVLRSASRVSSVLECGANIGLNLIALHQLLPRAELAAVEINEKAAAALRSLGYVDVNHESLLTFQPKRRYDLVFTSGVLIHIAPDALPTVYDLMFKASDRYVVVSEYYNPTPVEVEYRGHRQRMFKRDFAGEMLDRFPELRLVDYGFNYRRDNNFVHDDFNWFLLEKSGR